MPRAHVLACMLLCGGCTVTVESSRAQRCELVAEPLEQKVLHGTDQPTEVRLARQQRRSIGRIGDVCTATLVRGTWVVTAKHCELVAGVSFCAVDGFGDDRDCIPVRRVVNHPDRDVTLAELAVDATSSLGLVPILENTAPVDDSWQCREVEGAGTGRSEDGTSGRLRFSVEPIVASTAQLIRVSGGGERGFCNGDSGGPLLADVDAGGPRVLGTLSYGDRNCLGEDNFERLDTLAEWIVRVAGPGAEGAAGGCDSGDAVGWCQSPIDVAICDDGGRVSVSACAGSDRCGWSDARGGFDCVDPTLDPCRGIDGSGTCDALGRAVRCDGGRLGAVDCRGGQLMCERDPVEGARCGP